MRLMMTEFQLRKKSPYRTQLIFVGLILFIGVSRYIPLSHPEWLNFSPVLSFSMYRPCCGELGHGSPQFVRSSLPICFSIRLMDPPFRAFHARHRLFILPVFLIGKTLVKTKSLGSGRGRSSGSFCFPIVTCSFAWWSNPAYAKPSMV